MKDTVTKGTGNSRSLRTVPNALTLYPTYESMMQALITGSFPVDLGQLNPAGLTQKGNDLNKANLCSDALCSALGLPTTAVPNDAMDKLRQMAKTAQDTGNAKARAAFGSYTGTAPLNGSQTIPLPGVPICVIITTAAGFWMSGASVILAPGYDSMTNVEARPADLPTATISGTIMTVFNRSNLGVNLATKTWVYRYLCIY